MKLPQVMIMMMMIMMMICSMCSLVVVGDAPDKEMLVEEPLILQHQEIVVPELQVHESEEITEITYSTMDARAVASWWCIALVLRGPGRLAWTGLIRVHCVCVTYTSTGRDNCGAGVLAVVAVGIPARRLVTLHTRDAVSILTMYSVAYGESHEFSP